MGDVLLLGGELDDMGVIEATGGVTGRTTMVSESGN